MYLDNIYFGLAVPIKGLLQGLSIHYMSTGRVLVRFRVRSALKCPKYLIPGFESDQQAFR